MTDKTFAAALGYTSLPAPRIARKSARLSTWLYAELLKASSGGAVMRSVIVAGLALAVCGCSAADQITFQPGAGQLAIMRDGIPAIQSNAQHSVVVARPASRELSPKGRPVVVLAIANIGEAPLEFRVAEIAIQRTEGGRAVESLRVKTYEDLVAEERGAQRAKAIVAIFAATANAASTSGAGYSSAHTTVHSPYGVYTASTTAYSPLAAQIARDRAAMQNAVMLDNLGAEGQGRLAALESTVVKDNTLMPGEWYGGQLHIDPSKFRPADGVPRTYRAIVRVGPDSHVIDVVQSRIPK